MSRAVYMALALLLEGVLLNGVPNEQSDQAASLSLSGFDQSISIRADQPRKARKESSL